MALIYALSDRSTLPRAPGLSQELTSIAGHFTVYGVLAVLVWWALGLARLSPGRRLALAFLVAILYGLSDEWHQSYVPGRDASLFDIVIDAIGAGTGLAIARRLGAEMDRRDRGYDARGTSDA